MSSSLAQAVGKAVTVVSIVLRGRHSASILHILYLCQTIRTAPRSAPGWALGLTVEDIKRIISFRY